MDDSQYQLVKLQLNNQQRQFFVRNADTLLHVLREHAGITSVKAGCENGDCGSCTVLMDKIPINACHILASELNGQQITTMEGINDKRLQEAFIANNAIQCGYCTSGIIMNAHALLQYKPDADDKTINEWLDSNICRCTGYQEIKEAIKEVQRGMKNIG